MQNASRRRPGEARPTPHGRACCASVSARAGRDLQGSGRGRSTGTSGFRGVAAKSAGRGRLKRSLIALITCLMKFAGQYGSPAGDRRLAGRSRFLLVTLPVDKSCCQRAANLFLCRLGNPPSAGFSASGYDDASAPGHQFSHQPSAVRRRGRAIRSATVPPAERPARAACDWSGGSRRTCLSGHLTRKRCNPATSSPMLTVAGGRAQ